jgi:hypothetical protein
LRLKAFCLKADNSTDIFGLHFSPFFDAILTMETDEKITDATTDPALADTSNATRQDAGNSAISQPDDVTPKPLVLKRKGAPRRNKNAFKHGGRALQLSRQRGLPIDKRTVDGQVQQNIYGDLLVAWGRVIEETADKLVLDIDSIDPVTLLRMQMVSMSAARVYQHRRSRRVAIAEMKETMRKRGQKVRRDPPPKLLQTLDSFELPAVSALRADLAALGNAPNKEPVNLQDILAQIAENEQPDGEGENGGEGSND